MGINDYIGVFSRDHIAGTDLMGCEMVFGN
jgi:hypothetical protein